MSTVPSACFGTADSVPKKLFWELTYAVHVSALVLTTVSRRASSQA